MEGLHVRITNSRPSSKSNTPAARRRERKAKRSPITRPRFVYFRVEF